MSQTAAWVDPEPARSNSPVHNRVEEFLLEYAGARSAQRGLTSAAHQMDQCPDPTDPTAEPVGIIRNPHSMYNWDDAFGVERLRWATPAQQGVPVADFDLLVARAGNVLIVLEDTGLTSERTPFRLTLATVRALEHHYRYRCFCPR